MTYQNLGFWIGQANDTSTGRHPTGWTSGQRWSETAGEWTVMYDSSQSALASMTTDRDTWHYRADQAWGTTRVWSTGESWEAAYNRVLPPAGDQAFSATPASNYGDGSYASISMSVVTNPFGFSVAGGVITINKTGNYLITFTGHIDYGVSSGDAHTMLLVNGAEVKRQEINGSRNIDIGMAYRPGMLVAGTTVEFRGRSTNGQHGIQGIGGGIGGNNGPSQPARIEIVFIPNQTYPH